ncbi:hypothetical protein AB0D04_34285 [Streptomyces sp. NPDC048483]|uniref:hypothetical protein n=1 Tax=Streptomyces sp. NPDC048483 TaxID=3154927 RepID=UPI00341D95F0
MREDGFPRGGGPAERGAAGLSGGVQGDARPVRPAAPRRSGRMPYARRRGPARLRRLVLGERVQQLARRGVIDVTNSLAPSRR